MSTDLYGVRVLALVPEERRVRLRVFVVYYDTQYRNHQPLLDDRSFFFRILAETADRSYQRGGPLGDVITQEQQFDERFVDENAWRIIERVACVAERNHPIADCDWARYSDFYYARQGRWQDEELLVQGDYDVWVTDARWMEQLTLGQSWGTTAYHTQADHLRGDEAARLPDLRRASQTITPFPGQPTEAGTADQLAFSHDGRFLAVVSQQGELVVYDVTDGFCEHARAASGLGLFPTLAWLPDRHQLAIKARFGAGATWGYDVDARSVIAPPPEHPGLCSRSARFRLDSFGEDTTFALAGATPIEAGFVVEAAAFSRDERWLFLGGMSDQILVVDPARNEVVRRIDKVASRVLGIAASPDGEHLLLLPGGEGPSGHLSVLRLADGAVIQWVSANAPFAVKATWAPNGSQLALLVCTDPNGFGAELRVHPRGRPEPELSHAPATAPETKAPSQMNAKLIRELAESSAPFEPEAWRQLVADHGRWLDSGGGGGDGGLPASAYYERRWEVLEAAGLVMAIWTGEQGSEGAQACLRMRRLDRVDLVSARLAWADLSGTWGEGLVFSGADLRGVTATDAHFPGAKWVGADLRMADFSRAVLRGADFTGANLEGCDLEDADLEGAVLTGARIGGIKLAGARTEGIIGFGTQ